jgi:O-antigen ligase/tetratricopeptide (TPR) repeat protein
MVAAMGSASTPQTETRTKSGDGIAKAFVRAGMECVLLAMIIAGPWMYGAVHPGFELVLDIGLAAMMVLWGVYMLLDRRLAIKRCPVTLALGFYLLLSVLQITPLPAFVIRAVSPATANLQERLLPEKPETVSAGEAGAARRQPGDSVFSLYPYASRTQCFRTLALFLLFVVVRNHLATAGCMTRFAFFSVLNGVALCMFGLIQYYTSPRNSLYWTYPALGEVFGPFVSRNLFPFYVNCCIGLGLGLLMARRDEDPIRPSRSMRSGAMQTLRVLLGNWLLDSPALWLGCGIAFMAGTVLFTLSRGGVLALIGGISVALAINQSRSAAGSKLLGAALIGAVTVAMVGVFGMPAVEARLSTLWTPEKADAARLPLWTRTLPTSLQFPLMGTGQGTFAFVELKARREAPLYGTGLPGSDRSVEPLIFEHAHNDYVEVLIESGFPGLLLLLVALVFIWHYGLVAAGRKQSGRHRGLAIGSLAGLTAIQIHSFVDFGMRAPAIAWMVIAMCAILCGLGSDAATRRRHHGRRHAASPNGLLQPERAWVLPLGWLGAVFGAAVVVLAGAMLCADQWRAHCVERYQAAAAAVTKDRVNQKQVRLPLLQAACRLAPGDATANLDLAQCYLEIFREETDRLAAQERLGVFIDSVAAPASFVCEIGAGGQSILLSQAWLAHWLAREQLADIVQRPLLKADFYPGMEHCLAARDACPLMPEPHLVLGRNASKLASAEPALDYFERAKFLAPRLPEVWFFSGLQRQAMNDRAGAWSDWHHCLTLSPRFLDAILVQAVGSMTRADAATDLIGQVLPDDQPEMLISTAIRLFGREDLKQVRHAYFKAALDAFAKQGAFPPTASALKKAQIEDELGKHTEAEQTLQGLLLRDPYHADGRYQLAKHYFDLGQFDQCRKQLDTLRFSAPSHADTAALLRKLEEKDK